MIPVYPEAPLEVSAVVPVDDATLATHIITQRAAKLTREQSVGLVLQGVGTVAQFNRVWDEVEAERKAWEAVAPADHTTLTKYKAALVGKHLDATTWYNGMLAKHKVTTYADLVGAVTPVVEEL